jgi:hypothetical protein
LDLAKPHKIKIVFQDFIDLFPEIELPVTLGENSHHSFSEHNKPIHLALIEKYLEPYLGKLDEFTEYVACFRIPQTYSFEALVCWKANLNSYQYFLMTFTKKGEYIDHKLISGTKWETDKMINIITTIDVDWVIYQNIGTQSGELLEDFQKGSNQLRLLELLPDGKIIIPQ